MVNFALIASLLKFPRSRWLFLAVYSLSNGNNVWSGLFFRNSVILHSVDHLTSVLNHIVPVIVTHSMVHVIPRKVQHSKYHAIHDILQSRSGYCSLFNGNVIKWWNIFHRMAIPILPSNSQGKTEADSSWKGYEFLCFENHETSYLLGRFILSFPIQHQQKMFIVTHFMVVVLSIIPVPLLLNPKYSALFTSLVSIVTIDSGATFYSRLSI